MVNARRHRYGLAGGLAGLPGEVGAPGWPECDGLHVDQSTPWVACRDKHPR